MPKSVATRSIKSWKGNLAITYSQWAVGAGFFHSQEIMALGVTGWRTAFRIVYDCGTRRKREIVKREIDLYVERNGLKADVLYISHFDVDHVSGLPYMAQRGVKFGRIFAPLLTPVEKILLVARYAATGVAGTVPDDFYYRLVIFPEEALAELSDQPPIILGPDDNDTPPLRELPNENRSDEEETPEHLLRVRVSLQDGSATLVKAQKGVKGGEPVWEFRPKVLNRIVVQAGPFKKVLAMKLGMTVSALEANLNDPQWIYSTATTRQRDLRHAYDALSGLQSRNDTSLCLYSGPAVDSTSFRAWRSRGRFIHTERPEVGCWGISPGWLGTGDLPLKGANELAEFDRAYGARKAVVGYLALPHHGSRHNFNPQLFNGFSSPPTCVVGADGLYGHPHSEVVVAAAEHGSVVTVVSREVASRSVESVVLKFR